MAYIPPYKTKILTIDKDRIITVEINGEIIIAEPANDVAKFMPAINSGDYVFVSSYIGHDQCAKWELP